jgi:hypothetical protein
VLVEHLSRRRDRLIHLVPMPMGGDRPSGIWLALAALDVVVYEADTSRTHQEHIIAHELEAEVMASVILRRMNPRQPGTSAPETPGVLTRLERFFS